MLREMLDWVSIEKNKLVDYEAYMLGHECIQNEQASNNNQYLVGIFLDDILMAVTKEDQMGVDNMTLDSAAECVGAGIQRVCDDPNVPPS
jgi:hypothetical protein